MADRGWTAQSSWDATDGSESNTWAARRLAPPPPTSKSSSSSRLPSVPKRPTTVPSESSSFRQSTKGSKKIVLFRNLTTNDKKKKSSNSSSSRNTANESSNHVSNSRGDMSRRNQTSAFYNGNEPISVGSAPPSRPTIIRPQTSKKPKPPRPPPPKIGTSSIVRQPPSYDEVFGVSNVDSFIDEMRAPRPKVRAPPRPISSQGMVPPSFRPNNVGVGGGAFHHRNDTSATPLIDFDAPLPPTSSTTTPRPIAGTPASNTQSLLDLDNDFFMNDTWGSGGATTNSHRSASVAATTSSNSAASNGLKLNLGPRVLPPGPIPSLNSAPVSSSSNRNQPAPSWSPPALSPPKRGLSKGDDWLQSCLQGNLATTTGGTSANSIMPQWDSPANPPLPPRPRNGVGNHFHHDSGSPSPTTSPEPPSATPPPVPPLPFAEFDSQFDDSRFDAPPLPPRPKNYETMRPHAIAIYDYAASQPDELSFKANDIVTLIHRVNESWLYGYTDDSEGIFPQTFVEIVVPLAGDSAAEPTVTGPRCLALYDFVAETESELSLCAGDVVALEGKDSNDWLRGTLNGKSGIFPATFVEVVEDLPTTNGGGGITSNGSNYSKSIKEQNLYVALYDFVGESGELTFREGAQINVSGTVNEEWMCGCLVGSDVDGRFPKSFVEKLS